MREWFKISVLVLSVLSVLPVLAIPLSMQAYEASKEQQLIDISKRMPGDVAYWRGIVDFKPWFEARGIPFLTLGFGLSIAWAALVILWYIKIYVK